MSGLDERLERGLHESGAPDGIDTAHVFGAVAHKRRLRRLRRRALAGGLAASVLVGTGAVAVVATRESDEDVRVATPATSAPTTTTTSTPNVASEPADPETARTDVKEALPDLQVESVEFASDSYAVVAARDRDGQPITMRMQATAGGGWGPTAESTCLLSGTPPEECARINVPQVFIHDRVLTELGTAAFGGVPVDLDWSADESGYQRAPLVGDGERLWAATDVWSEDAAGGHVLRLHPGERQVLFQGEILSFTPGPDVSWAVTRDFEVDADGTQYRLKRIVDDVPETHPIPAGNVPGGPPVSDGESVWVPTQTGALRFDAATGELDTEIQLSTTADARGAAIVQGEVVFTDGGRLVHADGTELADTGSVVPLVDLVATDNAVWATSATEAFELTADLTDFESRYQLPPGLRNVGVQVTGDLVAVSGLADLGTGIDGQVVVLIGNPGSARTVVIAGGADPAAAVVGRDLVFASAGSLFSVPLG